MGNISFSGLATGIDTDSLIQALVDAKRQPIQLLQNQVSDYQTHLDKLDDFAGKLTALRSAAQALTLSTSFAAFTAASSDSDIVSAAASSSASEGSHDISVSQLAKNQTGTSNETFASTNSAAGLSGTLSLTPADGPTTDISISSSDTLEEIRDRINNTTVAAFGTITFSGVPVDGTTVTVDGITYEFTAGAPSGSNVGIDPSGFSTGADAAAALAAAATGAGKGPNTTMTAVGSVVTVVADAAGSAGNTIAMSEDGDAGGAIALSGETLSGGGSPAMSASVLNVGTSSSPAYMLVLTGKSGGEANAFTASYTGTGSLTFATTQAAQDAVMTVDGIADIRRSSNVVTDVIMGVTLTLTSETAPGASVSVGVSTDVDSVRQKVQALLDAYNDLQKYIGDNTKFDTTTKTGGPLMGDGAVSSVRTGLSSLIISPVSGLSGSYSALSQLGITTESDGTLTMDSARFDAVLGADFQGVVDVFARNLTTGTNGVAYLLQSKIDGWMSSVDGVVTTRKSGLEDTINRLNDNIAQKESALSTYETSLKLQYARLEEMISTLNNQSSALSSISGRLA